METIFYFNDKLASIKKDIDFIKNPIDRKIVYQKKEYSICNYECFLNRQSGNSAQIIQAIRTGR